MTVRVAIVGATGYSGAQLARLLLTHRGCSIAGVFASRDRDGRTMADEFAIFKDRLELPLLAASAETVAESGAQIALLATPHEVSASLVPELLERGLRVLDLSGAFRLRDAELYPQHYGFAHGAPALLERAVYGLVELNRARLVDATLVAVPGCYPTASILGLWPVVDAGLVAAGTVPVIDALSGVSGAGRAVRQSSLFCEVSAGPYGVFGHRHEPEIVLHAGADVIFTPHLVPMERGLIATIHVQLAPGVTSAMVDAAFADRYGDERFVRLLDAGAWPTTRGVVGTNCCDLCWALDERRSHLIVVGAIDNLVKGAAGQAVQAMNVMLGLDETLGLEGM